MHSGLTSGMRNVRFSDSSLDFAMRNVDVALHVVRHRPCGYIGFRDRGSPIPVGL